MGGGITGSLTGVGTVRMLGAHGNGGSIRIRAGWAKKTT